MDEAVGEEGGGGVRGDCREEMRGFGTWKL